MFEILATVVLVATAEAAARISPSAGDSSGPAARPRPSAGTIHAFHEAHDAGTLPEGFPDPAAPTPAGAR